MDHSQAYIRFMNAMQPSDGVLPGLDPACEGALPSVFAVTPFAAAAIGTAANALAAYMGLLWGSRPDVTVDARLASFWFKTSLRPDGWTLAEVRDPVTGDYATRDGWIRIHANMAHHREAAISVLGCAPDHESVAAAVAHWDARPLEDELVGARACAAAMRSREEWSHHPQGQAVGAESLYHLTRYILPEGPQPDDGEDAAQALRAPDPGDITEGSLAGFGDESAHLTLAVPQRPLAGLRVLDLTRVLAGPVSTRFLAGYGATVLRIDPPWWSEPGMVPEVNPGKRCAELDIRDPQQRELLVGLLASADVLVHGYRADALERIGLGERERQAIRPGLVDVSLNAYGWTGPWRERRGFDSLVQMSNGIAHAGMMAGIASGAMAHGTANGGVARSSANGGMVRGSANGGTARGGPLRPTPLPAQCLDQACGYLMAAAVLRGLALRHSQGIGSAARLSLARMGELLASEPVDNEHLPMAAASEPLPPETTADLAPETEHTDWGPAHRLRPPCSIAGAPMRWDTPAVDLRGSQPAWPAQM